MTQLEIGAARERMLNALCDCRGSEAERLRLRLMRMITTQELWFARCDVYALVSREHCESVAADRLRPA
jgi:hypothetical protein